MNTVVHWKAERWENSTPMIQQNQMLTVVQNTSGFTPPSDLHLTPPMLLSTGVSCLLSRQEMVTTDTGTTSVLCCSSQQIN